MGRDSDSRYRYTRVLGALGTIPIMMAVGPLVGFFGGRWLDDRFGTGVWMQMLFVVLGFVASIRYTVRLVRQARRDIDRL
jgi:ATP synthase protein I